MIRCSYFGVFGLILQYIGIYFGSDTWYGAPVTLIGALIFVLSYCAGMDKEDELINRITELEEQINRKEDDN